MPLQTKIFGFNSFIQLAETGEPMEICSSNFAVTDSVATLTKSSTKEMD
jgi:hypothetical protein